MAKDEIWPVLKELQNSGKSEIVPYNGIMLKKDKGMFSRQ
jgi:hypothetical protein